MADTPAAPAAAPPPFPFARTAQEPIYEQGDVAAGRALSMAQTMLDLGRDRATVEAALTADGVDPGLLDSRTPSQKSHDAEFGVDDYIDPSAMWFSIPPNLVGDAAAFNEDTRSFVASIALSHDAANSFAAMVVRAIGAQNAEADLAAAAERHQQVLRNVFGDQLEAKAKLINDMLDARGNGIENRKFLNAMRPNGIVGQRPEIFVALANRAAKLALWRDQRPKS